MSDPDDFDEVLRDLSRFAEKKEGEKIDGLPFGDLKQIEDDYDFSPEDELILGDDYITYLLFTKGADVTDFDILTGESRLEVKTEGFTVRRELGLKVDPEGSTTTYNNGVLSIKLRRTGEREAAP